LRLSALHPLLLLFVSLLQLLRLLLVPLFHLLRSRLVGVLSLYPLVLLFLSLLKFLSLLVLFRKHFFLLALVFLVRLRVPRIRTWGRLPRRKIFRVDETAGTRSVILRHVVLRTRSCRIAATLIHATSGWRVIGPSCLFRWHDRTVVE
jgi:hypothetical protein